jgi:hypothetical protein
MKKKQKNMTTINKSAKKNPLEDKKWLKNFAEGLKKDINKSGKIKNSPGGRAGEINCTQEDIGKPNYPYRKKKK